MPETPMALERFDFWQFVDDSEIAREPDGDWVRYADVQALFTREDVAVLREAAILCAEPDNRISGGLDSIADRIAALPPA